MIGTLVVFGASGDLTGRLLLPALAGMRAASDLGADFRFIGSGPQASSDEEFADHVRDQLAAHAPGVAEADREAIVSAVTYCQADVSDPADVGAVLDLAASGPPPGAVAVYLALPTRLMLGAVRAVGAHGLPDGSRVAVEKPFGADEQNAAELNTVLADIDGSADQPGVYRVDHALAIETLRTLSAVRVPGTEDDIEWTDSRIAQIDLLWQETLALEGRASFYDQAGALRDVMQNHLIQLLTTIAQPRDMTGATGATGEQGAGIASARRAAVLRTVRPLTASDVATRTRRARYVAGRLAADADGEGREVSDYATEDGVDPARDTETFAEVVLSLDSPEWANTRFVLRAGKALDVRRRGVLLHLRPQPGSASEGNDLLWLDLDDAGHPDSVEAEPAAYLRILTDLLSGGSTYAVSAAETELAWHLFAPVLHGWAEGAVPLATYAAGSTGP